MGREKSLFEFRLKLILKQLLSKMLPSPKRMKFLQDNENQQGERIINSFPEISAQPINDRNDDVQLDLKHLAPISLEAELYKWPEPNRLPIYKKVNKNFRGEITKVK